MQGPEKRPVFWDLESATSPKPLFPRLSGPSEGLTVSSVKRRPGKEGGQRKRENGPV